MFRCCRQRYRFGSRGLSVSCFCVRIRYRRLRFNDRFRRWHGSSTAFSSRAEFLPPANAKPAPAQNDKQDAQSHRAPHRQPRRLVLPATRKRSLRLPCARSSWQRLGPRGFPRVHHAQRANNCRQTNPLYRRKKANRARKARKVHSRLSEAASGLHANGGLTSEATARAKNRLKFGGLGLSPAFAAAAAETGIAQQAQRRA